MAFPDVWPTRPAERPANESVWGTVINRQPVHEQLEDRAVEVLVRPQVFAVHEIWVERFDPDSRQHEQLVADRMGLKPRGVAPDRVSPLRSQPRVPPRAVGQISLALWCHGPRGSKKTANPSSLASESNH